jgi:hypothetical protein
MCLARGYEFWLSSATPTKVAQDLTSGTESRPTPHNDHADDLNGKKGKPRTRDAFRLLEANMKERLNNAGDQ